MVRKVLLIAALATPAGLLAQYQALPSSQAPPPSSTVVVPSTNIYVVGGGLYGTGVYVAQPAAVVPAESTPTTGISLSGRTGISLMNPSSESTTPGAIAPAGVTSYSGGYAGYSSTAATIAPEPAGRLINDLGPSYFGESTSGAPAVSLGEVAAQYRANRPHSVRTFTNADAERLSNKAGVTGTTRTGSPAPATQPQSRPEPSQPPQR
jgi:hypothetical protein